MRAIMLLVLTLFTGQTIAAERPIHLVATQPVSFTVSGLNEHEWSWLGMKGEVAIGIYGPIRPPIIRLDPAGNLSGYMPNLIQALVRNLGLRVSVKYFPDLHSAAKALQQQQIDMIFQPPGLAAALPETVDVNILPAQFVEISRQTSLFTDQSQPPKAPITALLRNDLSGENPDAQTSWFNSPQQMLASVVLGHSDRAILPASEAYYLIEQNYANSLRISAQAEMPQEFYRFFIRQQDAALARSMRAALQSFFATSASGEISSQWEQDDIARFLAADIAFTAAEQAWIKLHQRIGVSVSPLNSPFIITDSAQHYLGIAPDILALVSIKTGLQFNPLRQDSVPQNFNAKDALMAGPLIVSEERREHYLFTTPFTWSPEVLITRDNYGTLPDNARIAITSGQEINRWLKLQFPRYELIAAPNPVIAMEWVDDGKVDASVNTMIGGQYLIHGLFKDRLKLYDVLPANNAAIAFGVRRDQPELLSILNKVLTNVPSGFYSRILTHWQGTPAAKFSSWTLYQREYLIGATALFIVFIAAMSCAVILWRQIRRNKSTREQLNEQLRFRDFLINSPPRPVYVADNNGTIIHSNHAFQHYFNPTLQAKLGLSLYDRRHPLAEIWLACHAAESQIDGNNDRRFTLNVGNETRHIQHWMMPYINNQGIEAGLLGGWQDVTEYLLLLDELSQARESAEAANRSKSQFLATMSHEIRTPLSAIIGLLELQNAQIKGHSDAELIRTAHEASLNLMELIGDILDMSKIEAGHMHLQPEWSELDNIITPIVRVFSNLARQKGLKLNHRIDEQEYEILVDEMRLRQVITNLVGNAIKFTEHGEINISAELIPDATSDDATLCIIVADSGKGMASEACERVFQPFEQAENSGRTGTGLGLAISREIITLMQGEITLESQLGQGTTLQILLKVPCRLTLKPAASITLAPLRKPAVAMTVLIVDDHPTNRLLLSRQLALLNHHTLQAENGEEGLRAWRQHQPDIIISDCSMPVMDGPAMARQIRHEQQQPVVIIGLTANAQATERTRCLQAGMDECLFRPLELALLSSTLERLSSAPSTHQSVDVIPSDWIDLATLNRIIPDDLISQRQLLAEVIKQTTYDINALKQSWQYGDQEQQLCLLHRLSGTLAGLGIHQLSEQFGFIEELVILEEQPEVIGRHINNAENLLLEFKRACHLFNLNQ